MNETNEQTPQPKSNKKVFILVPILILFTLVALAGGSLAYAYYSNQNIPVLSDIVEDVENTVISEEKFAENIQSGISDMLFAGIQTATETAEKEDLLETDISESFFEKYVSDENEISSYTTKDSFIIDISVEEQDYTPAMNFSVDMDADSSYIIKDEDVRFESQLTGSYKADGMNVSASGNIKLINDGLYISISQIPALGFDLSEFENRWFKVDISENKETAETLIETETLDLEESITEEDLEKLAELINGETINKSIHRLDDKIFGNVRTYCYEIDMNGDDIVSLIQEAEDIWEVEDSERTDLTTLEEMRDTINKINMNICTGRQDGLLYRISVLTSMNTEGVDFDITASSEVVEYNPDITITEPKDYEDLVEVIEEMLAPSVLTYEEFVQEYEALYEEYGVEMDLTEEQLQSDYQDYLDSMQ